MYFYVQFEEYLQGTLYSFLWPSTNNNTKGGRLNKIKLGMAGIMNSHESYLFTYSSELK